MWSDFSIGDVGSCGSAVTITVNHSENSNEYWWSYSEFSIGGKVAKNTLEGKKIAHLVGSGASGSKVDGVLLKIAVARMSPTKIVGIFAQIKEEAFRAGEAHRAATIREALAV